MKPEDDYEDITDIEHRGGGNWSIWWPMFFGLITAILVTWGIIYGATNTSPRTDGITIRTIEHDGRRYDIITKRGKNGWFAIPIAPEEK